MVNYYLQFANKNSPIKDNFQFYQFIAYVAYPIDLFEEGSVTNLLTVRFGLL